MMIDDKEKDKVQEADKEKVQESSESTYSATNNLPIREWVPIKVGENRTSGTTTTSTQITGDVTGWDKPTDFNFKAPVREKYVYDPNSGFMSALKPPEPERDVEREERMKKVARVNAFGDFVKHLGDFSGGGYAPTEKRTENQNVLRALHEVDKLQDLYAAQKEKHNDKLFGLRVQDYTSQEARSDREYDRKYNENLDQAKLRYQSDENMRQAKEKAYWEGNTKRTQEQNGKVEQYKNGDLLNLELMAKKKAGSGKSEDFDFYKKGVGDIRVNKSGQIQIGTRIASLLISTGKADKESATAMLSALKQPGQSGRLAFQSLLDYAAADDTIYEGIKEFEGHGMEIIKPESPIAAKKSGEKKLGLGW